MLHQFACRNADTDWADSGSSWPMGRQGRCEKDQNGPSHQPVSISIPARKLTKPCKLWMARDSACLPPVERGPAEQREGENQPQRPPPPKLDKVLVEDVLGPRRVDVSPVQGGPYDQIVRLL